MLKCFFEAVTLNRPRRTFPRNNYFTFDIVAARWPPHYGARIRLHILNQPFPFRRQRRMFKSPLRHMHGRIRTFHKPVYPDTYLPRTLPGPFYQPYVSPPIPPTAQPLPDCDNPDVLIEH